MEARSDLVPEDGHHQIGSRVEMLVHLEAVQKDDPVQIVLRALLGRPMGLGNTPEGIRALDLDALIAQGPRVRRDLSLLSRTLRLCSVMMLCSWLNTQCARGWTTRRAS